MDVRMVTDATAIHRNDNGLAACASDIGLLAGEWPQVIVVGEDRYYRRNVVRDMREGDLLAVLYSTAPGGGTVLTVFND